jgi:hypothetical protein
MKDTLLLQSIETVLKRAFPSSTILNFSVKAGSSNGDNYLGVMHSIAAELEDAAGNGTKKHLILKASSENEARKEFGENLQVFHKEAAFYKNFIPELLNFQTGKSKEKLIVPAFVKCYDVLTPFFNKICDGKSDTHEYF